jgi:hypothetical protein
MMDEDRRVPPSSADSPCAGAAPEGTIADGSAALFPELSRTEALLLCLTASGPTDVGLVGERGTIVLGPAAEPLRDQPLLRPGQETWYRLDAGRSALAAFWATGFRGHWSLRARRGSAAPLSIATLRIAVDRGLLAGGAAPAGEEDEVSPR